MTYNARTTADRLRRVELTAAALGSAPPTMPWQPPAGDGAHLERAGIAWDAVRAPAHLAAPALSALGPDTGAVIRDPYSGDLYWLLPVGVLAGWRPLPDVRVYGTACWIDVPARGRTGGPGPYWVVLPDNGRLLTHPATLHHALDVVIAKKYPTDAVERLLGPTR